MDTRIRQGTRRHSDHAQQLRLVRVWLRNRTMTSLLPWPTLSRVRRVAWSYGCRM
jgi:hypothetical protein